MNTLPAPEPVPAARTTHRLRPGGSWKIAAGEALSLRPPRDARLRAVQGGLWVTWDAPPGWGGLAQGDCFLPAGAVCTLPAGTHVVVEAWNPGALHPHAGWSHFGWEVLAAELPPPQRRAAWLQVLQPLDDLRAGCVLVAGAVPRLAAGLVRLGLRFATDFVASGARVFCRERGFGA